MIANIFQNTHRHHYEILAGNILFLDLFSYLFIMRGLYDISAKNKTNHFENPRRSIHNHGFDLASTRGNIMSLTRV